MAGFSNYVEKKILEWLFKQSAMPGVVPVYVSLHTADPADLGTDEVSGSAYARVGTLSAVWNTPVVNGTAYRVNNAQEIAFPAASGGNWGTITYFGLWDLGTAGNFMGGGTVTPNKIVNDGDQLKFAIGNLNFNLD